MIYPGVRAIAMVRRRAEGAREVGHVAHLFHRNDNSLRIHRVHQQRSDGISVCSNTGNTGKPTWLKQLPFRYIIGCL